MRFLIKGGKNNKDIREQLQAVYIVHALQNTAVKKWAGWFPASSDSIENKECEGQTCSRNSADNVQKVKQIVEMNCE